MMNPNKNTKTYLKHLLLFLLTLVSTTLAGAEWIRGTSLLGSGESMLNWAHFTEALHFSVPFLGILTFHEFGHYFMARRYSIPVTLPFYIPGWLGFLGMPSIGTFGAVIRIKGAIQSAKEYFDVGIAGPLAGFVVAIPLLVFGFSNLPPADFIFEIHPEYASYGEDYANYVYEEDVQQEQGTLQFKLGANLLFMMMEKVFANPDRMPNYYEIIHYPYLFAGYLALFFTAINLLPIGQLDGGHVVFGLFGPKRHAYVSQGLFIGLLYYSGLGLINPFQPISELAWAVPLYIGFLFISLRSFSRQNSTKWAVAFSIFALQFLTIWMYPGVQGYTGWLLYGFLLGRVLGIHHPPVLFAQPLDQKRKVLGWLALLIFILCFSPQPFVFEGV
jgi:membrane-associated protease RseP (regulator of RpoE activity)